jgi:oligopeptide transport system substrate-binding protein
MARVLSVLAAIIATLVLDACGGTTDTSGAFAGRVGGETGAELAALQVLRWGNGPEPGTLDPHKSEGVPSSNIDRDLFEGLVNEAPDGRLVPGAAESWKISADGRTYTFRLRASGRWSNGDPVTAQHWVYSLRRSLDPATLSAYTFILFPIENAQAVAAGELASTALGVRAIDDHTLEIRLENPTPYFLGLLTHSASYAVHPQSIARHGDRYARPGNLVSNGAYMLDEWVVQSHVKLVRNPNYWDNDNTTIDEVYYYNMEDRSAELRRYRADELDISYTSLPQSQLPWIRENLGGELVVAPYLATYYYGFNLTRPPFEDNPALRRALALAIDRDIITTQVLKAGQIPAYGWVPELMNYESQVMPEAVWTQDEREAEARRLYREAGYTEEKPLHVKFTYNTDENHRGIALAVASMWNDVLGVETALENQEWKVFLDTRKQKRATEVFRDAWIGDYNDAYTFAELLLSDSGLNHYGYDNPEYDRLLAQASTEGDLHERARILEEAERLMLADMPILPIYFYVNARLIKPWVDGYTPNIMDHHRTKNFRILAH